MATETKINILPDGTVHIPESQTEISMTLSYLIGVNMEYIKQASEGLVIYQKLDKNKHARIVRNLCILRTDIMKNYGKVGLKMRNEAKGLLEMPEYISEDAVRQLSKEQIGWYRRANTTIDMHIVEINRLICDRINNCKNFFPLWLEWNYVRNLFIMPNGLTKAGIKEAQSLFWRERRSYPYQVYINWIPEDAGNILFNDWKIVNVLYKQNNDSFDELNKVCDIGNFVKENIYRYIADSNTLVFAVDCENADPYKLCAALRGLPVDLSQKVSKIILFDDANTCPAWRILEEYTAIPVEYKLVERVTKFKSLVDTTLTATISKEHYLNGVDSFVLVSSDSDYWGMISSLTGARFLLMVERDSCGAAMKETLREAGVFFCYLDDFYTGGTSDIRYGVLLRQIRKKLNELPILNLSNLLNDTITDVRIDMSESEQKQFYEKYLRKAKLDIDAIGNAKIVIE